MLKTVDYESQLRAIKALLDVHQQIARVRVVKIAQVEDEISQLDGVNRTLAKHDRIGQAAAGTSVRSQVKALRRKISE